MQLPQIRITSERAYLDIKIDKPVQSIEQPPAELTIKPASLDFKIEGKASKLTIDQVEAWANLDLKHIFRRIKENADFGQQGAAEGTGKAAEQGDELMRIESKGNPLADQAKQNSENNEPKLNFGNASFDKAVKFSYEPKEINVDIHLNRAEVNVKTNPPKISYQPGKVNLAMKSYGSIKIDFANLSFNGLHYEQKI